VVEKSGHGLEQQPELVGFRLMILPKELIKVPLNPAYVCLPFSVG
jgi:hypothetical protein